MLWDQAADEDGFDAICDSLSPLNISDRTSSEQTRPIPPHMPISKAGYVGTLQHACNSSDYIETSPAGNWKQSNGQTSRSELGVLTGQQAIVSDLGSIVGASS